MAIGAIAAAVGGSLIGSILQNRANKKEAQRNRDFQEQMSNTAIQRRMEDLRQAGLNPLLAVNSASNGASTPSGAQANYDYSGVSQGISNGIQMYQQMKMQNAQIEKMRADTNLVKQKQVTEGLEQNSRQVDIELKNLGIYSEKLNQRFKAIQSEQALKDLIKTDKQLNQLDVEQKQRLVNLKRQEWELQVDMDDIANTRQGRMEKHYSSTAPSNPYQLGYMGSRLALNYFNEHTANATPRRSSRRGRRRFSSVVLGG